MMMMKYIHKTQYLKLAKNAVLGTAEAMQYSAVQCSAVQCGRTRQDAGVWVSIWGGCAW